MKGVLPWFIRWACCAGTRDFCSALAALVETVQNIFPSPNTISILLTPSPSNLGRQPCWVAYLLVCVSLVGNESEGVVEKEVKGWWKQNRRSGRNRTEGMVETEQKEW